MVERLGKSNEIFLSQISKKKKKLWGTCKRKLVEGRVGLGALFSIKLNNVFEANVVDDIGGKEEGRV